MIKLRVMYRILVALVLFAAAFGYVEAAVVTYLRSIYTGDLFPLMTVDQLRAAGPAHIHRLGTELGREAATILMLGAVALVAARNPREWMAAFAIVFGVWDITYYAGLKVLLNWPDSFLSWDLLFLLPVPWVGPVIAPMLVSAAMVVCGVWALARPVRARARNWLAILAGALLIVIAFAWDYRNTMAGRMPNPFQWLIFMGGLLLGVAGFLSAAGFPRFPGFQTRRGFAWPPRSAERARN